MRLIGHEKCLASGDIVVLKYDQNPEYLAYTLSTIAAQMQKRKGKVTSMVVHSSVPAIKEIMTPIPPLPAQHEIVQIPDNFAEPTARRKQYKCYRNELLAAGEFTPKIEFRNVVKKGCSGSTPIKGNSEYYENGTIPWIRTRDIQLNEIHTADSYISEQTAEEAAAKWMIRYNKLRKKEWTWKAGS
jgi:type I restriction enzyme S subunit